MANIEVRLVVVKIVKLKYLLKFDPMVLLLVEALFFKTIFRNNKYGATAVQKNQTIFVFINKDSACYV
jgi:hypothetical protein